jgi:hypothetical protein
VDHIKDLPKDTSAWWSSSEAVFLSRISKEAFLCNKPLPAIITKDSFLSADPGIYSFLTFIPEPEE